MARDTAATLPADVPSCAGTLLAAGPQGHGGAVRLLEVFGCEGSWKTVHHKVTENG